MTRPEREFRAHLILLLELATDANIIVQNSALAADRSFTGSLPQLGTAMERLQILGRKIHDAAINAEIEINIASKNEPDFI